MTSLNTYEGNIQQEHATFEPNEIDKLKEEIHGLKLENETLKIQATSIKVVNVKIGNLKREDHSYPNTNYRSNQKQIPSVRKNSREHE